MIDDAMKGNRIIGMIQTKSFNQNIPNLYSIGCAGKITNFNETEDGRYLIVLVGVSRFKITEELKTQKLYRKCKVDFKDFYYDLEENNEEIKFSDLELIFKKLKSLFIRHGYVIDWNTRESLRYGKRGLRNGRFLAFRAPYKLVDYNLKDYPAVLL